MHITVVAVGLRQPGWADEAVKDYLGRFPKDFTVVVKEVKAEPRAGQPAAKLMQLEAERIRKAIPAGDIVVAMDEHGRDFTTMDFAKKVDGWKNEGCGVTFLIGGSFGLDETLKKQADWRLSMSPMTFPHHLARVMLLEQIYRACQIAEGTRYHK